MFIREHYSEDLMRCAMFIIYGRILNTQKLEGLTSFQSLWSEVKAKAACWFVAICVYMHVGFPASLSDLFAQRQSTDTQLCLATLNPFYSL